MKKKPRLANARSPQAGDYWNENDKANKTGFDLHHTDEYNKKSANTSDMPDEKKLKPEDIPLKGKNNEQWQRVKPENKK